MAMQEEIRGALMKAIQDTKGAFATVLFEMTGIMVDKVDISGRFNVDNAAMSYIGVLLAARKASLDSGGDGQIANIIVSSNMTHVVFAPMSENYLVGMGVFLGGNLGQALLTMRRLKEHLGPLIEGHGEQKKT